MNQLVALESEVIEQVQPDTLFLPYREDVPSDHAVVFDAASVCCKSFRCPCVKNVYAYETLSETDFGIKPSGDCFKPNLFVDGTGWLEKNIEAMGIYQGEMREFLFPRSEVSIRALASLRGGQAGVEAAESFMVLKEIL
ncbi:PIG-L deacetylase family protein [Sedimenticola sp.]|uniref:PIG-L deacetylase family protein n=1 Tax=Sedimenticola sp. TaxID=1940285 RepID=UPI003D14B098